MAEEEFFPLSQKLSLSPLHDEAVSASASELLYSELSEKNKLLEKAQKEAREYKIKCDALMSSMAKVKKRQRDEPPRASPALDPNVDDEAPRKKPSPTPSEKLETPSKLSPPEHPSDDDVPPPASRLGDDVSPPRTPKPFEQLHSILCAYKAKKVVPGSSELPFDLCALLCKEEGMAAAQWTPHRCIKLHRAVLSALKLVYPSKMKSWFQKPFLRSPTGTAKYWAQVLTRRAEIWQAAADRAAARALPPQESLKDRIRRKIAERKAERVNSLSAAFRPKGRKASARRLTPPAQKLRSGLSSDSDDAVNNVIDLSQSPAAASSSASSHAASTSAGSPPKMAPHPTSYSLSEMKTFKKMAKAIRNVNERDGHAEATAAFIDSEFSDNSGITVKALKADAWRRNRVNNICEKAAKIMEDRRVY